MILHSELLESRFVLIKIFINLGGSHWLGNPIIFDSFRSSGRGLERLLAYSRSFPCQKYLFCGHMSNLNKKLCASYLDLNRILKP